MQRKWCLLASKKAVRRTTPDGPLQGDGRIRTDDGGFADPCLNLLATSPDKERGSHLASLGTA